MPLEFRYHDPQGDDEPAVWVSLSSNSVPFGTLQLSQAADLGEAATSGLEVEDPDGTWDFVGLRALSIYETSAPSNNQVILRGRTQDRSVSRGDSELTGAARVWSIDLSDYNFHLGKRILTDSDAKRPAESAGDRLRWLLNSAAHIKLHDHGYVTYPSQSLDACDYRGQRPLDLLADCAVEGGYNFWCDWNEAHNCSELYFMLPSSALYESTASISNDLSEVGGLTFAPNDDARLTRSPSRIAFGVYLPYANGAVYVRNTTTRDQFTDVDQAAPMSNVKREARARRIATKFLNDHDEEEDKVTCSIWVPSEHVNVIRAGHRVPAKFTHFPGWESGKHCRVLRRTVVQDPITGSYMGVDNSDAAYRLDLELVPVNANDYTCSTALWASENEWATAQNTVNPATVTITPSFDGTLLAAIGSVNPNTPAASDMANPAGYTNVSLPTWGQTSVVAYKAASSGVASTASATFDGGWNNYGSWVAGQIALPVSLTLVQSAEVAGREVVAGFPSAPTPGNILIMFSFSPGWGGALAATPIGDGWVQLLNALDNDPAAYDINLIEVWGRCAVAGDSALYQTGGINLTWGYSGGHPISTANYLVITEWSF